VFLIIPLFFYPLLSSFDMGRAATSQAKLRNFIFGTFFCLFLASRVFFFTLSSFFFFNSFTSRQFCFFGIFFILFYFIHYPSSCIRQWFCSLYRNRIPILLLLYHCLEVFGFWYGGGLVLASGFYITTTLFMMSLRATNITLDINCERYSN